MLEPVFGFEEVTIHIFMQMYAFDFMQIYAFKNYPALLEFLLSNFFNAEKSFTVRTIDFVS